MVVKIVVSRHGRPFKAPDIEKIVSNELEAETQRVKKAYEGTTGTWVHKPKFYVKYRGKRSAEVRTKSKVYRYVDSGTRPHVIRVKRAKTLAFNTQGFQSKTVPRRLKPRAGKRAGPPKAFPVQVFHPGFPARGFSTIIRYRSKKRFKRNVDRAIRKAVAQNKKGKI